MEENTAEAAAGLLLAENRGEKSDHAAEGIAALSSHH